MTKKTVSKSRFPVLRTVAGVLAAGVIAWVIVERFDTPAVLPAVADAASNARVLPKTLDKPLWRDLSSSQQVALAPLEPQWDRMEGLRKRKWIEMSAKFASMPPLEQQRVHERMRQWMRLTPEQRDRARENFSKTNRLAGDKSADWENYKQLSADEKRNLARAAARKPAPVALPPEAPAIITPMPCPPNTTRRGAECIVVGAPEVAPAATASTPPAISNPAPPAAPAAPAPASTPASAPSAAAQAANASN